MAKPAKKPVVKAAENTVVFKPYVGERYASGRKLLGKKILIVGASHYCEHYDASKGCSRSCKMYGKYTITSVDGREFHFGKRCQDFSKIVMRRYCGQFKMPNNKANSYFGTFTKFLNAFFYDGQRNAVHEERALLADELAQTEFVMGAEANTADGANSELFGREINAAQLRDTVRQLMPDVIITWGNRVKKALIACFKPEEIEKNVYLFRLSGKKISLVTPMHPSASRFDKTAFNKQLQKVGVKVVASHT